MRTNEPKIWKNNKNTEARPKLSGYYKKKSVCAPEISEKFVYKHLGTIQY